MVEQVPVITSVGDEEQLKSFEYFVGDLRADNVAAARDEAQRLSPYFTALSRQMALDVKLDPVKAATVEGLTSPEVLSDIFNAVAVRTKNTILSQILIAPEGLLNQKAAVDSNRQFNAHLYYGALNFNFGFMQTLGEKGTTTFPILTMNDGVMEGITPFRSQALLESMQAVATAGNHDMLHHYTNVILNPTISQVNRSNKDTPEFVMDPHDWSNQYFRGYTSDSDINSFESWLMLDHLRIRRLMDEGPEGRALEKACDTFFDELGRIGKEMTAATSAEEAHRAVDYLGTMLLFTMMRYMPMDHPLMLHAIERLQQADPDPAALEADGEKIVEGTKAASKRGSYTEMALMNYKNQGVDLTPEKPDYADLKRLQLIQIAPWIVHLLSPEQEKSNLAEMKAEKRVGNANLDMVSTSAAGVWFDMSDGQHTFVKPDGTTVEVWLKDGKYHREDGPAYITVPPQNKGRRDEQWYRNGERFRPDKELLARIAAGKADIVGSSDDGMKQDGTDAASAVQDVAASGRKPLFRRDKNKLEM